MSKSDADLKRRSQALSTNNRGFISRARFGEVRENLHDEDDEDIRLETYRTGAKVNAYKAIAKKESRGQKIIEILEESPNGYEITGKAPPEKDRAIKYYSFQLRQYTVIRFPEEYGLIHYSLGKVFFADRPEKQVNYDMRAKSIENALHHFRLAAETFDYDSHPFLFGTINIFIGQLFRERATLISSRSLLAKRGVTVSDCCAIALSQLMEAQSCFLGSRLHDIEYCLANLETAWVYVLQLTEAIYEEGRSVEENEMVLLREQAIIAIDRAKSLVDDYPVKPDNEKPRTWDPLDQTTHPEHIRLLIMNQGISYIGGLISYLTGRLHQEWNEDLEHQEEAFNNYCRAVKPGRLPMETETWVDAHHRAAALAIKYPKVVDTSFGDSMETDSDLCYVSSVKHLEAALKSSAMMPARKMDILFHLAQAQIARLHMITDRVPEGQSLIKALAKSEGITIMKAVESSLVEAMKGSTAANTQSTQDAFIYYFSCLKLSEFRMLQAAAEANLQPESREALLEDSIGQLVNALLSRSIIDNLDLHYVGTAQMAGMLMSSKRDNSAAKWFGKTLMCASAIGNRVQGSPVDLRQNIQGKFWEESCKQHSNAMLAASRHAKWVKTHLGPILLTESPTSGYAYWSMEMNLDPNEIPIIEEKEVIPLTYAQIKANRAPPSALQPHLSDREKEQLAEKTMLKGRTYADKMLEDSGVASLTTVQNSKSEPSAPMGAVPLWAMGQHPDFDGHDNRHETERKKISDKAQAIATAEANAEAKAKKAKNAMFGGILKLFGGSGNNGTANIDEEGLDNGLSPYIGRRRHLVPNMYVMINEVHDILATSAENAIFLMVSTTPLSSSSFSSSGHLHAIPTP